MTPEDYIDRLINLLGRKKALLLEMREITVRQSESIGREGLSELQKLVDEKQLRIDAINKLDDDFSVYFQRLKSVLGVKSLDGLKASSIKGTAELKKLTGEITELLTGISSAEKTNSDNAKALLNKYSGELRKINQGRRINSAYTPPAPDTPSLYIDKKK